MSAPRPLTLAQAQARYPQRYTCDHVPQWATYPLRRDRLGDAEDYPGPAYASDAEWYDRTAFPGEHGLPASHFGCVSTRETYPWGRYLPAPFADTPPPTPTPNPTRKEVTRHEQDHQASPTPRVPHPAEAPSPQPKGRS